MPNVLTLLHAAVERNPSQDALMWKEDGHYHKMTYDVLWQRAQSFAYGLKQLGVRPGGKVALLANNSPAWAIGDVGIMMAGAVSVPIYPTLTAAQIDFILQNADVEVILVETEELAEKVRSVATGLLHSIIVIEPNRIESPGVFDYPDFLAMGYEILQQTGPLTAWQEFPAEDLATIVHTSGTTGNPKGVMLTHQNLVANIEAMLSYIPIQSTDITLSYLPLSHILERTCGQFAVLTAGGTIAYAENLTTIAANILEVKPTLMVSVPRLFEKIYDGVQKNIQSSPKSKQQIFAWAVKVGQRHITAPNLFTSMLHPIFDRLVFSKIRDKMGGNIRLLVSGGAALALHVGQFLKMAGIPVAEGYGMTEASPVISTQPFDDIRLGTVGRPLVNVEVKLAEDGELLARGPSIMAGYYKNPEATAATFDEDGWLKTGDIAELHDGYLRIVERKKNILVLATGKNVAPFPIESAMQQSPYISQAVLFGDKRKYITALVVPDFQALTEWAVEEGISTLPTPDLLRHDKIKMLFQSEIDRLLADFAPFERPKKFTLLPRELTLEAGELTATMKVRTHVLQNEYKAEIEAMYAESTDSSANAKQPAY